jgi:small subunit ribosomal protein S6
LKEYEAVFILSPKLSKEDVQKVADALKKSIESAKGGNIVEEKTERRPLNFAIKKQREGIYMIYKFTAPPDAIEKVKEDFKHNESVLRYAFIAAYKKEEPKQEGAEKES